MTADVNKFLMLWFVGSSIVLLYSWSRACPWTWHGGSPQFHGGSCWCGNDGYCMCTPSLAIDAIINVKSAAEPSIILVRRMNSQYAIPGGFVGVGETVENAATREVKEETNLDVSSLDQFRVYSDPKRDSRRHTVSSVFICYVENVEKLHRGDDAKSGKSVFLTTFIRILYDFINILLSIHIPVSVVPLSKVLSLDLAFDHHKILSDYINHAVIRKS